MSKRIRIVVVVAVAVVCVACAALLALLMGRSRRAAETAWQVQYALGMWHLSEGSYEEAAAGGVTSAPTSGLSALGVHNLEQLDMTTFSLSDSETITVCGVVQRNAPFPSYRLKLDHPVEITLSTSSSVYDEVIVEEFSCEYLYFYNEDMVEYDFDTEQLLGCRCVITARLENYRGGGSLYFLYPVVSMEGTDASAGATKMTISEFVLEMSDAWTQIAGTEHAAYFEEAFLEFVAFRDASPAFPADWFPSFFEKEIVNRYGVEDGWAERIVGDYYARWSSDPDPWYDNPVDDMIEGFYGDDCGD